MNDYNLRNLMEKTVKDNRNPDYLDESIAYTIMGYHSCKGSVLDFTKDDWRVCQEHGWTVNEVVELCETDKYHCNCCGRDFVASDLYSGAEMENWPTEICCPDCGAPYEMNDEHITYVERYD